MKVFDPMGVQISSSISAIWRPLTRRDRGTSPALLLMETITNPILRVAEWTASRSWRKSAGAALIVDNTFATPLIMRPLEIGATFVVHSLTKYLAGHGDVLGGIVISDEETSGRRCGPIRGSLGPVLGPFDAYLAMRGIKTFPLRMERQCANACRVAGACLESGGGARFRSVRPQASRRGGHPPLV